MQKDHHHSQEQFLFCFLQFSASVGIPEAMVFGSDDIRKMKMDELGSIRDRMCATAKIALNPVIIAFQ